LGKHISHNNIPDAAKAAQHYLSVNEGSLSHPNGLGRINTQFNASFLLANLHFDKRREWC